MNKFTKHKLYVFNVKYSSEIKITHRKILPMTLS